MEVTIELIEQINFVLALGGVALFLGAAVLIFDYYQSRALAPLVERWGMAGSLLLVLGGSIMTLIYSEIFGFVPCGLCWLQRVALYPQVLILATANYLRDTRAVIYTSVLSVFGILIGLYQHYLQMGGSEFITCPAAGADSNCAERILFEFGFMTFPLLSVALFTFLLALNFYILRLHREAQQR